MSEKIETTPGMALFGVVISLLLGWLFALWAHGWPVWPLPATGRSATSAGQRSGQQKELDRLNDEQKAEDAKFCEANPGQCDVTMIGYKASEREKTRTRILREVQDKEAILKVGRERGGVEAFDLAKNIKEGLTPGTPRHEMLVLLLALNETLTPWKALTDEDIKAVLDRFEEARKNTCLGSDCRWHEWMELRNKGNIYIEREETVPK